MGTSVGRTAQAMQSEKPDPRRPVNDHDGHSKSHQTHVTNQIYLVDSGALRCARMVGKFTYVLYINYVCAVVEPCRQCDDIASFTETVTQTV